MQKEEGARLRAEIRARADRALRVSPVSLVDTPAPMSAGGPHDYYSNGDYWWPNPASADGLPYIRRDGESNPKAFRAHRRCLTTLKTCVADLAAAYRLTGDERYARKAVAFLQRFYLDESTRMNPRLPYAQAIPGVCTGRGIGLIDLLHMVDIPVAVETLKSSPALRPEQYDGLKAWFADYLRWMTTHPYGKAEMKERNNHSVTFWVQAAVLARFTGNEPMRDRCRERYREVLLPGQMAADGSFPLELARTKPYSYSIFVLDNMVTLCQVLSTPENRLWDYELEDGRSIRRGLAFLVPYMAHKDRWPYRRDITHFDAQPGRTSLLLFAALALGRPDYLELWERLDPDPADEEVRRNAAIRQPLLWLTDDEMQRLKQWGVW